MLDVEDAKERENIRQRAIDYTKEKKYQFYWCKKERINQKQHVYDPENLTLSHSYNVVERHNFEIDNYIDP